MLFRSCSASLPQTPSVFCLLFLSARGEVKLCRRLVTEDTSFQFSCYLLKWLVFCCFSIFFLFGLLGCSCFITFLFFCFNIFLFLHCFSVVLYSFPLFFLEHILKFFYISISNFLFCWFVLFRFLFYFFNHLYQLFCFCFVVFI